MMKIGFVSMPLTGHLNPMTALARKLRSRGHEVVFFAVPDAERIVRAAGLNFAAFGEKEYPIGATPAAYAHLAKLTGEDVILYSTREMHPRRCRVALEQLPAKLLDEGIQALVIDATHFFVELIPISMGMPYVHVWNVLHMDRSGVTPPCIFDWPYEQTPEAAAKYREGARNVKLALAAVEEVAKSWAEKNGLQIDWSSSDPTASKLAIVTQTPREFDFPGACWPATFHYTGPFLDDAGREPIPFAWERLTGQPLVYASMGTLVNGSEHVFRSILDVAGGLPDTQLVLSVGNNLSVGDLGPVPANTIVVPKAPQIELLKRAVLCITHAGINTVFEALAQGVALVAIPVGFDQPGVAARIAYHGVGEFVPVRSLTRAALTEAVQKVLKHPSYRDKARYFQNVIAETHGLNLAADVIERAFQEGNGFPQAH
jgi:MGT family glycosyltransferase